MTRFAFGGKWRGLTTPWYFPPLSAASAAFRIRGSISAFSAISPKPAALCPRNARRFRNSLFMVNFSYSLISRYRFVQVEDDPRHTRHRRQILGLHLGRHRRLADRQKLSRAFPVRLEVQRRVVLNVAQRLEFHRVRLPLQAALERPAELRIHRLAALIQNVFG